MARVVISKDWTTTSPCGCGGFAYVGVYDLTTEFYKPAFVFYNNLGGGNEKFVSEAISHEVGHNLGLIHDGVINGTAHYTGHGSGATGWAPIMGVGYYKDLVQWSKGEYLNANNKEDDLARMQTFGAPLFADDHGATFGTATPLSAQVASSVVTLKGGGIIGANTDVDMFSFSIAAGPLTLNINPASRSPNLDLLAQLYYGNGALLASVNPNDMLNASISVSNANAGLYYLKITGVGKGDLVTGYSNYGSIGQYTINGSAKAVSNITCNLIASHSEVASGENYSFTISGTDLPSPSYGYWFGTKGGSTDQNGVFFGAVPGTFGYTNSPGTEGYYTRYVDIRNAAGQTICTTPTVSIRLLPAPTCNLSVDNSSVNAGDSYTFTAVGADLPRGAQAYWYGTKNSVVDVSGELFGLVPQSVTYYHQSFLTTNYTRRLEIRDGTKVVCTTNTVNVLLN